MPPHDPPRQTAGTSPWIAPTGDDGTPTLDLSPDNTPPGTPARIGHYEVLGVLGEGGMGVVYKARDPGLKRLVALKMIRAAGASDRDRQRFRAEAEAIARLQHPNIVGIFEVGEFQGQPYCALEYVDGGSLDARLAGQPLPPRKATRVAESLARAAHAVHELQLIHRDLKPANVLLQGRPDEPVERCTPKISDFGLAKMLDGAAGAGLTREGAVMGTPYYMAPEQAAGRVSEIDRRADVYSLGAILYELLTGRPPIKGATVSETLWKVLNEEPASPRKVVPEVDRDLEIICLKCLEKEPQRRFATALELADELDRYLNDEPILTRRVGLAERALKWARRRPAAAAAWLMTLLVVVLGSAGGFAGWQWLQAEAARGEAEAARQQAEEAKQQAEDANAGLEKQKRLADEAKGWAQRDRLDFEQKLKEARGPAQQIEAAARRRFTQEFAATLRRANEGHYLRQIDLAHRCWRSGQLRQARALLGAAGDDGCGWEYGYVDRLCNGSSLPLPDGVTGGISHLAFSPDGSRLAAGCYDAVHVWDFPARTNRLTIAQPAGWVAFSPDGSRLALPLEKGVRLVDAKTGKPAGELKDIAANRARLAAFSPDGRRLAVVEYGSDSVVVYDLATGKPVVTLAGHGEGALMAAYSPDGSRLATATAGGFRLWDAASGKELLSVRADTSWHWWPLAFSPDGRRVACIDGVLVRSWDAASGALVATGNGRQPLVRCAAVLAGGQLVSGGSDATVRAWDAASGKQLRLFRGLPAQTDNIAVDPKGRFLAAVDTEGNAALWDATVDQEARVVPNPGGVTAVAFAAGGDRVATVNPRGARLIETATGREVAALPGRWSRVAGGGRWLAVSGDDGLAVLDTATGREAWREKGKVTGVAFSPDGSWLAVAGDKLLLRDAATGKLLRDFIQGGMSLVAFTPDGRRLAVTYRGERRVELLDAATGNFSRPLNGVSLDRLAFHPDGKRYAAVAGNVVTVWDADADKAVLHLPHVSLVEAVAFSPDGRRLATAGWDRVIQLWDVEKGEAALTLPGHEGVVRDVSFSPDGRWLASGGDDGTLRLWDAMAREKGKANDGEAKGRRDADVPR